MTILTHLLSKRVIISRLTTVSGNKTAFATTTGAPVEIQPLSPAKTQLFDGVMGKTYSIYADPTIDIQEGDKLRNSDSGAIYKVRNGGVSRRTQGSMDFLHIIVEQIN